MGNSLPLWCHGLNDEIDDYLDIGNEEDGTIFSNLGNGDFLGHSKDREGVLDGKVDVKFR